MSSTACFVGSSTASRRRSTIIGRITSRYLPRTYRSRSTSSAMPQMKFVIQFRSPLLIPAPVLRYPALQVALEEQIGDAVATSSIIRYPPGRIVKTGVKTR